MTPAQLIRRSCMLAIFTPGVLVAAAAASVPQPQPLPLESRATTMELTEDGEHLIVAHEDENLLTVWDVRSSERLYRISCPAPRAILTVGGRVYVASFGRGRIQVYDPAQEYALVDQLNAGDNDVYWLTAPATSHFDRHIFASTLSGDRHRTFRIDVTTDEHLPLHSTGQLFTTGTGRHFRSLVHVGSSRRTFHFNNPAVDLPSTHDPSSDIRLHHHSPDHTFSERGLMTYSVRGERSFNDCVMIIPDRRRRMFYVVRHEHVTAHRLDALYTEVGRRPVALGDPLGRYHHSAYPGRDRNAIVWSMVNDRAGTRVLFPPMGTTLEDHTYLFLSDPPNGTVYRLVLPVFEDDHTTPIGTLAAKEDDGFAPLMAEAGVSAMTLSEDGRTLFLLHPDYDTVSVWDVAAGRQTASIQCPGPSAVLSRGERLFISTLGDDGNGRIDIYRIVNGLAEFVRHSTTGHGPLSWIDAPRGEHFSGWLVGVQEKSMYQEAPIYLLNTHDNLASVVQMSPRHDPHFVSVSYDGQWVVDKGGMLPFEEYARPYEPSHRRTVAGRAVQLHHGTVWMSVGSGMIGPPLTGWAVVREPNIFDTTRPLIYQVEAEQIEVLDPRRGGVRIGQVSTEIDLSRALRRSQEDMRTWTHAATVDGQLYFFSLHRFDGMGPMGVVRRAVMPAPSDQPSPESKAPGPFASDRTSTPDGPRAVPLHTIHPVSSMILSDDGRYLITAHEWAGRITLFDVITGSEVRQIETPAPRFMLSRGNLLLVANYGHGTLTVMNLADIQDKDEPVEQLIRLPHEFPYHLSAATGSRFRGTALVACLEADQRANRGMTVMVQTGTGQARRINDNGSVRPAVSFDGQHVLFRRSPTVPIDETVIPIERFLRGETTDIWDFPFANEEFLEAIDGNFWRTRNNLHSGLPPRQFGGHFAVLFVDETQPRVYDYRGDHLRVFGRSAALPQLAEVPLAGALHAPNHPLAVTHDGTTYLFMARQRMPYRLVVHLTGTGGPDLPPYVIAGRPMNHRLNLAPDTTATLVEGPPGLRITPDGAIQWRPPDQAVGPHRLRLAIHSGEEVTETTAMLHVVPANLTPEAIAWLDEQGASPGRHTLQQGPYHLADSRDRNRLLMLRGNRLNVLDAEGYVVLARHQLPDSYRQIHDRGAHYVAVALHKIDLIDSRSLRIVRTIPLGDAAAVDMAAHPRRPITYVTVFNRHPDDLEALRSHRVLEVNESTGAVRTLPRLHGGWVAVDPGGERLFVVLKDVYRAGMIIDWLGREIRPALGPIDLISSYGIRGSEPVHQQTNINPGNDGAGVRLSGDGRLIAYLPRLGYSAPEHEQEYRRNVIPLFDTTDVTRLVTVLQLPRPPVDASFHPTADLVAATDGQTVGLFRRTGEPLEADALELNGADLREVNRVRFTPGGRHLLIDYRDDVGRHLLQAFAVNRDALTRAPVLADGQTRDGPPSSPAGAARLPTLRELEAMGPAPAGAMTPVQIYQRYRDTVVIIRNEVGIGTGFVVGSGGYIVTTNDNLLRVGDPQATYTVSQAGRTIEHTVPARVVATDPTLGLALLKLEAPRPLPYVRFTVDATPALGDDVQIIAHTELGRDILNHQLLAGSVAHPRRMIGAMAYLQLDAPLARGGTGSPVFDANGHVIAVVGRIDADRQVFALPIAHVAEFLRRQVRD